ncbi:CAP domain-containing protein [Paracoccus sp. (in: a-proteobacteria)]|uniref:CAP domain-containing protein n=1 Tax=Paracoccus sp. TaxID=267 RepID=UPI00396C4792
MPKPSLFSVLLLSCTLLAACAADPETGRTDDPHAVQVSAPGEARCLQTDPGQNAAGVAATNQMRRQAGLPPVRSSMQLAQVAAAHACDMARRGRMTHIGSTTTGPAARVKAAGYRPSVTAENIAAGPYSLPRVLQEWNKSQGHLNNILLPQVRDYGVGQALGPDGRTIYWAAVYSAPQ